MSNEKGYRFDETFKAFSEFVWENPKDGILRNAFNMALFYLQRERKEFNINSFEEIVKPFS